MIFSDGIAEKFNVNKKHPDVFRKQMSLLSDPILIENFITPEEVEELKKIELSKPASSREGRPSAEYTEVTFNNWEEAEKNLLQQRLQQVLGDFQVWGGNYFSTSVPYLPHVDTGANISEANYKNIVIPLQTYPAGKLTHLVLFKQRYFGNNTGFYGSGVGGVSEFTCNESLYDYSAILNLEPNHQIDSQILKTRLNHVNHLNLKGLSISQIIPWKVGSCIIFDSAQIHCSSDFTQQGIIRKSGYSLFTLKC